MGAEEAVQRLYTDTNLARERRLGHHARGDEVVDFTTHLVAVLVHRLVVEVKRVPVDLRLWRGVLGGLAFLAGGLAGGLANRQHHGRVLLAWGRRAPGGRRLPDLGVDRGGQGAQSCPLLDCTSVRLHPSNTLTDTNLGSHCGSHVLWGDGSTRLSSSTLCSYSCKLTCKVYRVQPFKLAVLAFSKGTETASRCQQHSKHASSNKPAGVRTPGVAFQPPGSVICATGISSPGLGC
jgi:hypothetical protein